MNFSYADLRTVRLSKNILVCMKKSAIRIRISQTQGLCSLWSKAWAILNPNLLLPTLLIVNVQILWAQSPPGDRYMPITLDPSYEHTKWGIEPGDLVYHFAAYTTSFDSDDDNNGDSEGDIWGIPEWVAYEIKEDTGKVIEDYRRPTWMTDDTLHDQGKAPDDATYAVSGTRDMKEVKTDYRYVRGHMCPKDAADRISMEAGYNTHTVLNAVPQLQWQNNGVWKSLEEQVVEWADTYQRVWVICGPVFFDRTPAVWLGQNDEVRAAVPDAIFKIVIREADAENGIETLAFLIPNVLPKEISAYSEFLTSIGRIEGLTGIRFLTALSEQARNMERTKNSDLSDYEMKELLRSW